MISEFLQSVGTMVSWSAEDEVWLRQVSRLPSRDLDVLEKGLETHQRFGDDMELLDSEAMQARVHSPTYLGGLLRRNDTALVDPAQLCWGLRAAGRDDKDDEERD